MRQLGDERIDLFDGEDPLHRESPSKTQLGRSPSLRRHFGLWQNRSRSATETGRPGTNRRDRRPLADRAKKTRDLCAGTRDGAEDFALVGRQGPGPASGDLKTRFMCPRAPPSRNLVRIAPKGARQRLGTATAVVKSGRARSAAESSPEAPVISRQRSGHPRITT